MSSRRVTYALSRIGDLMVGVEATRIVAIVDTGDVVGPAPVDLAAMLSTSVTPGLDRRVVEVRAPVSRVVLGPHVDLSEYDRGDCHALPRFIAPALSRRAVSGLLRIADEFAFIIALDRLPGVHPRRSGAA